MDLDLTAKKKLRVKLGEDEIYDVYAPTVIQAEAYQKELASKEGEEVSAFLTLLNDLGLPRQKAEKLDVVQIQTLSENLLGMVKKK